MPEPAITVVVPTRDRPAALGRCLGALAASELAPHELEVVVVDDGGASELEPVLARAAPFTARLLRVDWSGPGAARNTGIAAARGATVLFTDDDCLPAPGWARELSAAIAREEEGVLAGGRTTNALVDDACACASQVISDLAYEYHGGLGRPTFLASNNLGARRDALEVLGGFDPHFRWAEDREICDRWRLSGRPLVGVPAAHVRHAHALDLRGFVTQHFGYGRGAYRLHRSRVRRRLARTPFDPSFHLDVLRSTPRHARAANGSAARLVPLLLLWQLANCAGFLCAAARGESASRA